MQLPEIILEIGTNYYEIAELEGITPLDAARKMIFKAKQCEAVAVKFQWYKAEKLVRPDAPAYWQSKDTQFEVFKRQDAFGLAEYRELKAYCDEIGIEFLCTAFDEQTLEQLNPLVKRHKTASADITHGPLLEQLASYGKPVILSTGAATEDEIDDALRFFRNRASVTLLHCVLDYPCEKYHANLVRITNLAKRYRIHQVGYSDHCMFDGSLLLTAWLLGASLIEKHFTLTHKAKGNDHEHAGSVTEIIEFQKLITAICGAIDGWSEPTIPRALARRGVYLARDVKQGECMALCDVEFLRPQNKGIGPMEFYRRVKNDQAYESDMKQGEQIHG